MRTIFIDRDDDGYSSHLISEEDAAVLINNKVLCEHETKDEFHDLYINPDATVDYIDLERLLFASKPATLLQATVEQTSSSEVAGLPVQGYKPTQSTEAVAAVNKFKELEEVVLREIDALRDGEVKGVTVDQRHLAIGRTNLELAFMSLNRSIFQPQRIQIPEDEHVAYRHETDNLLKAVEAVLGAKPNEREQKLTDLAAAAAVFNGED